MDKYCSICGCEKGEQAGWEKMVFRQDGIQTSGLSDGIKARYHRSFSPPYWVLFLPCFEP